jgi:hypothetical protein
MDDNKLREMDLRNPYQLFSRLSQKAPRVNDGKSKKLPGDQY